MVNVRKANEKDIEDIFELYWLSSKEHEAYHPFDKLRKKEDCKTVTVRRLKKELKDDRHVMLVAVNKGKAIGFASGSVGGRDEPDVFEKDICGFIDEIVVATEFRYKGLGTILLTGLQNRLFRMGAEYIGLAVASMNPAMEFYSDNGYNIKAYWMIKAKPGLKENKKNSQSFFA